MVFFHFGYLDASSGSMLLQVLFGGVLGSIYVSRKFIQRTWLSLKSALSRSKSQNTKAEATNKP